MKAWVLQSVGNIEYIDMEQPNVLENEVLIKVKVAGICGSDIPRIYQNGAHNMPLILGHEFSGQIVSVGDKVSREWLDKRVGVFPLIPCKKCTSCQTKKYEMCSHYNYLGSRCNGGFAEYISVPEWNIIELPANISYEEAAMLEPISVAFHSLNRVDICSKDAVVVYGLGTIGMLIVMLLLERNVNNILVVGNKEFQKKKVIELGLSEDNYCDSACQNVNEWIYNNTNQKGADVSFECVGKNETFVQAINNSASLGRICVVGNPYSDMMLEKDVYWKILRNQLMITGTWNSSFTGSKNDDWHKALKLLADKRIAPKELISHRFKLENLKQGFHIMRDKSEEYIKIMAIIDK